MSHPIHLILSPGTRIVTRNDANGAREQANDPRRVLAKRMQIIMGMFGIFASLFGASCSKKTIRAEFVNARDNTVIALSDMKPDQLPDSFAIATTMEIKEEKWSVERAEPQDKSGFLKTGKVRIYLTPITVMPPGDILFSLPTIANDLGTASGDALPSPQILALHEDDWRQVEFVARKFSAEIDAEIADIRRIYQEQRAGVGFKKLHVRERIPNPLDGCTLRLPELETLLTPKGKFDAVGFQRARGTIPHSFAWQLDDQLVIWGTTNVTGKILCLCLLGSPGSDATQQIAEKFSELDAQHGLTFVDWCRATHITTGPESFSRCPSLSTHSSQAQ